LTFTLPEGDARLSAYHILVIDDDATLRSNVVELLSEEGFDVAVAKDGADGLALAQGRTPDLVVCDILMPGMDGYQVLEAVRRHPATRSVPFIFLSSKAERQDLRRGMDLGADDYVSKPFELTELLTAVLARLRRVGERLPTAQPSPGPAPPAPVPAGIVIGDPRMQQLHREIERAAHSNINVLLLGETGVGKEVLARALHQKSRRHARPFLALNCAALSESLLESELFGHEKGAFTNAAQARAGLLEGANGGSVFLDEIGDMPSVIQAKLLRVLEERKVMRVGGRVNHDIDVRFISATNKPLELEVERGSFRTDLYYRINGLSLWVPPLRERRTEIAQLAQAFIARARAEHGGSATLALSPAALDLLLAHDWPGNIRELKNEIERAVVLADGDTLEAAHFSTRLSHRSKAVPSAPFGVKAESREGKRQCLIEALAESGGNQTVAARRLGISRRALVYWLTDFGLRPPRPSGADCPSRNERTPRTSRSSPNR
jgi:two-component system response regulator AtoC